MNAEIMQQMIDAGLLKPSKEPTFFQHPSGYDLVETVTSYNSMRVQSTTRVFEDLNAKLEPSS